MAEKTMLTDLYQLTMNAAYLDNNKDDVATFDLFIRKLPKDWGYFIANGIEEAVDYLTNIKFSEKDVQYLQMQGIFKPEFLEFLKGFRFEGCVYAVKEGTPVFPNEPILRVTAKRTQAQFVETALLNIINFQTMIATKASRVVNAASADGAFVADFGLRRAQGEDAAMKGARACYLAGAKSTSNVKAGMEYGIPISGTHAHAFVMSYPTELEAFRAYARTFPNNATLLIDTYDTMQGAANAAVVARELLACGHNLCAVRLDSGDLGGLAKKVRALLDEQGLSYVKIVASNDLNEYKIKELVEQGAPINAYGVGTEMITAKPIAALPGVYKLVADVGGAKIKLSPGKRTLPGIKQVYRILDEEGAYAKDVVALEEEDAINDAFGLLELAVKDGKRVRQKVTLEEAREYCRAEVAKLPGGVKAIREPAEYPVVTSAGLDRAIDKLTNQYAHSQDSKADIGKFYERVSV